MADTPGGRLYRMLMDLRERKAAKQSWRRRSKLRSPMLEEGEEERLVKDILTHIDSAVETKRKRLGVFHGHLAAAAAKSSAEKQDHVDLAEVLESICEELGVSVLVEAPWISETWFTIFRLRQAFFLMCAFSILLALFTGLLMEGFFSIMGGAGILFSSVIPWITWHLIFWLLPFVMIVLALLGDEMCDLILDSLDFPPLHVFQAMVVTAMYKRKRPWEHLPTIFGADCLMVCLFELVPFGVAVASATMLSGAGLGQSLTTLFVEGYIQGSLLSAVLCTMVFVVSDMSVAGRSHHTQQRDLLASKIDERKMKPYCLYWGFKRIKDQQRFMSTAIEEAPAEEIAGGQPGKGNLRPIQVLTGIVVFCWTLAVLLFTSFNHQTDWWDPIALGLALVLTVTCCSVCLNMHCPSIYGAPYVMILVFFVSVGISLNLSSAIHSGSSGGRMEAIMSATAEDLPGNYSLPRSWRGIPPGSVGRPQPYPLCNMRWGSPDSPLRALDLASLAWIVYDASAGTDDMQRLLSQSFPGERRAKLVSAADYQELPRWAHIYFPPAGKATNGTRVVAVKGTSTVMDGLVDTNLFSTVKVLQMFSAVLPVLTVLPRLVIQWLLHHVHVPDARRAEQQIWTKLEKDVRSLMKEYPNDSIVITGHSLGGGIAQVVGARLSVPALVWSAPGAELSATRFGIQVQSLKRSVVSVMPDHDVVPRVDLQGGMLQLIECRMKGGAEASALDCHSLVKTACEVWRACGDDRDFRRSCEPFVNASDLGGLYAMDDTTA